MIDFGLQGRRAVVSGAGSIPGRAGHGPAVALRLAEAGATLACIDIDPGRAAGVVQQVRDAGGRAVPVVADMTEPAEVERALDEVVEQLGGLDVCVDIVGGARWSRVEHFSDEDWTWTLDNNLSQVFYLFRSASRHMIRQGGGGSLVSLASVDGIAAAAFHAAYGAAKAGVISLTKTFAQELGRHGIRVNAVAPGNVGSGNEDQTDGSFGTTPVNPLAPPRTRDVANAVLFLSSELAARVTGQTLIVDGGAVIRELWGMDLERASAFRAAGY